MSIRQFPCARCGATLTLPPGARSLECTHCGHEGAAPPPPGRVPWTEDPLSLAEQEAACPHIERLVVRCAFCEGETTLAENVTSDECAFCGRAIVATGASRKLIRPHGVLPFSVQRRDAEEAVRTWLGTVPLAPGGLTKARIPAPFRPLFVPVFAFDADCVGTYSGRRGDADGRSWEDVDGTVEATYVDILVSSSFGVPKRLLDQMDPWDLADLAPYDDVHLAGTRAESPAARPTQAFARAEYAMRERLGIEVRARIGGDRPRVDALTMEARHVSFRLLLLPVWVGAIRHRGTDHVVVVSGRTGDVFGDAPTSNWKLVGCVLLLILGFAVWLAFAGLGTYL